MKILITCLATFVLSGTVSAQSRSLNEDFKLRASDAAADDYFGTSVAVSGETVVVGARYDDDAGYNSGSAYIYQFDGENWNETKLLASDGAAGDFFGISVAVSGETVVVGATNGGNPNNTENGGAAYIYQFDGENWNETKLLASDADTDSNVFGCSVAISGDTVVVGSERDDDNGSSSGSAYIYQFDGENWNETKLLASDGAAGDSFGTSVAVSGETVVVGAHEHDDNGNESGSGYIYQFDGKNWNETKLLASDGAAGDYFGISVAVSGETVIVGAPNSVFYWENNGAAYIYQFDGKNWNETKLLASDGAADDYFGTSVAVSGETVVVGANGDDLSGSAYAYQFDGKKWIEYKLLASEGAADDYFGTSVAVSGETVVVGANGDDLSGSAYIFVNPVLPVTWTVDDDGKADFDNIQSAIDAANNLDEIVVMPGTYTAPSGEYGVAQIPWNLRVHLRSVDPTNPEIVATTIIDGQYSDSAILCFSRDLDGDEYAGLHKIIEGFTFINCYGFANEPGGAISNGGSLTLSNCKFEDNYSSTTAGGIYNRGTGSLTISNCTFENNEADDHGGGLYSLGSLVMDNCIFTDNTARYGGGIYITGQFGGIYSATISNCVFTNNSADDGGGMMAYISATVSDCTFAANVASEDGGGVFNAASGSFMNCIFEGNSSNDRGGGMYNGSDPALNDCRFTSNSSQDGGGMYNYGGSPILEDCVFETNAAIYFTSASGGGLYNLNSLPTFINCEISDNVAEEWGGGMCNDGSNLIIEGCTISGNIALYPGGGVYNAASVSWISDTAFCENDPDHIYGAWVDLEGNTFEDVCEDLPLCFGDVNSDYNVDVLDLLYVIAVWGTDNPSGDINGDGWVDVGDILAVISVWGACP